MLRSQPASPTSWPAPRSWSPQRRHPRRLRITHVQSRPDASWTGERGRIDEELLRRWLGDASPTAGYCVCVPEPVLAVVAELGVPDGRFHGERYPSGAFDPAGTSTEPREMLVENVGRTRRHVARRGVADAVFVRSRKLRRGSASGRLR
ncbi:hypothetical protein [Amycolatopsis rubida]|uniref:hypothetical protein n=1 Tax=Amycolatopsis rubida TaxID=112413 RepID=UPI003B8A5D19